MGKYKLIYIYCEKKDGIIVRKELRNDISTQADITICGSKSTRYILKSLKKEHKLQPLDIVATIDCNPTTMFLRDCEHTNVYNFQDLTNFLNWFYDKENQNMINGEEGDD